MQLFLKWAGIAGAALVVVLLGVAGYVYAASERAMAVVYDRPSAALTAAGGPEAVARGARLARIYGCRDCHADNLQGSLFHDEPMLARLRAPNLTRVAASWSDADIDRALRHGVRPDGRGLWVMPSSAFSRMSDADAADIAAYLRSRPAGGPVLARSTIGPMGRVGIVLGKFHSEPQLLKTDVPSPVELGPDHAHGRYLAMVACGECHGPSLQGGAALKAPDLMIAASYDREAFARFMRTGIAADGKERRLMSAVARARFSALTDAEIAELHAYLVARAEQVP